MASIEYRDAPETVWNTEYHRKSQPAARATWGIYFDGRLVQECSTHSNAQRIANNLSSGRFAKYSRDELSIRRI